MDRLAGQLEASPGVYDRSFEAPKMSFETPETPAISKDMTQPS